jgi:hypothetical protein
VNRACGPVLGARDDSGPLGDREDRLRFAADLGAVIDFYNTRFTMHLAAQDKADLVAFLQTL